MSPPPHHYGNSYAASDFQSVHFKPTKPAGPDSELYDRSNLSRKVGLVGVGVAALVGLFCIVGGIMISKSEHATSSGGVIMSLVASGMAKLLISMALNLVVALCIEAIGFVHGIALRSALASEKRLRFNTNIRLLSAASGFFNPNGTFLNITMAILLIVSYSSSSLVALWANPASSSGSDDGHFIVRISEVPLIVLGVALLLQAVIALACVWAAWTKIMTWSSSPFDLTAALIHHTQITPVSRRCMLSICDDVSLCPVTPSPKQPSAWRAHPSIRKVVWALWTLVAVCFAWGLVITCLSYYSISRAIQSRSFLPNLQSNYVVLVIPLASTGDVYWKWTLSYVNLALTQGSLALALHYSELLVNVIRDERMWRKATSKKGTTISSHPLAPVFGSPLNFGFLLAKPLLHALLGRATTLTGAIEDDSLTAFVMSMWPLHILIYAAALLIVSLTFTTIVFRRPKGPQPTAYGHVQTLANLIDEWSSTMWWGDKGGGLQFRHAGTSDHPLPKVDMNAPYA